MTWRPVTLSTPYSCYTPQNFSGGARSNAFSSFTKKRRRPWPNPKISWKFSGEWKFVLWCYGQEKSRTGYILSNFTPQVREARNQSPMFNTKSISRNTTHRQSSHPIQMIVLVEWSSLNADMRKFESSQKDESGAQSAGSSKAVVLKLFEFAYHVMFFLMLECTRLVSEERDLHKWT